MNEHHPFDASPLRHCTNIGCSALTCEHGGWKSTAAAWSHNWVNGGINQNIGILRQKFNLRGSLKITRCKIGIIITGIAADHLATGRRYHLTSGVPWDMV